MQELPKSTAFGLLNTLREYEMVSQGRDGRYSLGIRLFEYGCRVSRAWDVPRLGAAVSRAARGAGERVGGALHPRGRPRDDASIRSRGTGVCVSCRRSGGRGWPLHCTSQGKVFLAALAESEAQALLGGGRSRHTRPTRSRTRRSCWHRSSRCGGRGYAVEDGEV